MKKAVKIGLALLLVLVIAALGAELYLGWVCYTRLQETAGTVSGLRADSDSLRTELVSLRGELTDFLDRINQEREDPAQENDVTIAGSYVIRSTLPISDAYLSGDRSGLTDKQKETLDMAAAILEQIITPDMSPYDKEEAVYVWMTENLQQDEGLLPVIPRTQADCDNPYGVLKFHNAVCVGYATTFRLFMQMLEIPCMVVHNSECYHSWDLVQLDGGWYHTDIYSDSGRASFRNFNLTDGMQAVNQNWNHDFFPAADATAYCYVVRNAQPEDDLYHIPAALRQALDDRAPNLSLRFEQMDETGAQIAEMMLSDISSRLSCSYSYSGELNLYWNWMPLDQGWLLSVTLEWYNSDEPDPVEIPDEAYEKSQEAVDEAFGDLEYEDNDWVYNDSEDWAHPVG